MLTRTIRIQLVLFAVITLVGVSYVSARYVGLTRGLFGGGGCTVSADFPDSGGIFTNAEVTYRGVTVGRVGSLSLIGGGVRVGLRLDSCAHPRIPASVAAVVADRSVVGEQYVNLVPPNGDGPFLSAGQVIPMQRNRLPVATQVLLTDLDRLVRSVDTGRLAVTVSELGQAFSGSGPALGGLLDSSASLLAAARQNLPATLALIGQSSAVLRTALDEAPALRSFASSLRLLSGQLKASDPDIRRLLDDGPAELATVRSFVQGNRTDLGVTLANLATTGQLLVRHRDGLEEILELYPALAAGGQTVLRGDYAALGLVVDHDNDPKDCGDPKKGREGYEGTTFRVPSDLSPQPPNVGARCTAPVSSGTNVRGSANVPGGDPISTNGAGVAYPRVASSGVVSVGDLGAARSTLGDESWIAMLTDALN